MKEQEKVEEFMEEHCLEATKGFRILDLVSEVGEVAGDAAKSADYGLEPDELEVDEDEIGDVLFSLLALAESLGIDSSDALEKSLEKYESRIGRKGDPGSG